MSSLTFSVRRDCRRFGLKGPQAEPWLLQQGVIPPTVSNSWTGTSQDDAAGALLVGRLGRSEFFVEETDVAARRGKVWSALQDGVYPVLREDAAFALSGDGTFDVLTQVCNVDFSALILEDKPLVMTSMAGVSVLVVPCGHGAAAYHRIWCDPSFGAYLESVLGTIVAECGGNHRGGTR